MDKFNNKIKLKMVKINKSFPGVKALEDVNFELEGGTVHAIVGENGAGKSTLIKILTGAYKMDAGEIFINEKKVNITSTTIAKNMGINAIYQEFSLIPELSISQNIFLGKEKVRNNGIILNNKLMEKMSKNILEQLNVYISPRKKIKTLNVGEQQLIEIAKALMGKARIIIMDEPTSALSDEEKNKLFEIINKLKKEGIGIIYISHRMKEIFKIADYVTILRDGRRIKTSKINEISEDEIVKSMVGRELGSIYIRDRGKNKIGNNVVLKVENLSKKGVFENINFYVRKGEILGISGLMGSGRTEIVRCIFGLDNFDSGKIIYNGEVVKFKHPSGANKYKIGLVPEDRKRQGIVPLLGVKENLSLPSLNSLSEFLGLINLNSSLELSQKYSEKLNIKMSSIKQKIVYLSGGNQQKVVLGKWLAREPELLILDEPTRGIDVGAKAEIHKIISSLADNNVSIIMISSELPEILGVSDRIIVIHEGRLVEEFGYKQANEEMIIKAATGN